MAYNRDDSESSLNKQFEKLQVSSSQNSSGQRNSSSGNWRERNQNNRRNTPRNSDKSSQGPWRQPETNTNKNEHNNTSGSSRPLVKKEAENPSLQAALKRLETGIQAPQTEVEHSTFKRFCEFPAEIRCQIWREVARIHGRIIEIERVPGDTYDLKVCKASRSLPVVMMINKEARVEAIRTKILRRFDISFEPSPDQPSWAYKFWFSPTADTIYFGDKIGAMGIVSLSRTFPPGSVQKLAIKCSRAIMGDRDFSQDDDHADYHGMTIPGGLCILALLHGVDGDHRFPGFQGLREITWVVNTSYKTVSSGEVDPNVVFRPAVTHGKTTGQIAFYHAQKSAIRQVQEGHMLDNVGANKWLGDEMPSFRFQTLAPGGHAGRVHRCVAVWGRRIDKLGSLDGALLFRLQRQYDCVMEVANGWPDFTQETSPHQFKEIGFYGREHDFPKVRRAIDNFLNLPLHRLTNRVSRVNKIIKQWDHLEDISGCKIIIARKESPNQQSLEIGLSGKPANLKKVKDLIYNL